MEFARSSRAAVTPRPPSITCPTAPFPKFRRVAPTRSCFHARPPQSRITRPRGAHFPGAGSGFNRRRHPWPSPRAWGCFRRAEGTASLVHELTQHDATFELSPAGRAGRRMRAVLRGVGSAPRGRRPIVHHLYSPCTDWKRVQQYLSWRALPLRHHLQLDGYGKANVTTSVPPVANRSRRTRASGAAVRRARAWGAVILAWRCGSHATHGRTAAAGPP